MRAELVEALERNERVRQDFIGTGRAALAADRYRAAFEDLVRFDLSIPIGAAAS